jgi:lysozyme family protein
VSAKTGVPWWWIATAHQMESGGSFTRHLHNGDPLTARTVQVPKGRPKTGKPPFSWTDSAIDALTMSPHELDKVERWGIARALYELERYNGFGYFAHQINSPYLWSYTTLYEKGKYVADGKWSASAVSKQCGAAAIIKAMVAAGMIKL